MYEQLKEIFSTGIENKESRDNIVIAMVQVGATLNTAQKHYTEFAKEAGLSSPKMGYREEAFEYITKQNLDVSDPEIRARLKVELVELFKVAGSTAGDYVKLWATNNGIELPVSNFGANPEDQEKIFTWITANLNCDKPTFKQFMEEEMGRSSGSTDETYRGIILARKLQEGGHSFSL